MTNSSSPPINPTVPQIKDGHIWLPRSVLIVLAGVLRLCCCLLVAGADRKKPSITLLNDQILSKGSPPLMVSRHKGWYRGRLCTMRVALGGHPHCIQAGVEGGGPGTDPRTMPRRFGLCLLLNGPRRAAAFATRRRWARITSHRKKLSGRSRERDREETSHRFIRDDQV